MPKRIGRKKAQKGTKGNQRPTQNSKLKLTLLFSFLVPFCAFLRPILFALCKAHRDFSPRFPGYFEVSDQVVATGAGVVRTP
ncbi:hypothetical protein R5W24_001572 [Gemmata sp. JC717]|uniref:hypothetical protein n=1 Tax=Gemmata algarum TaxID=2975278 RepID=UPI0021BA7EA6|nr:hypothetical protein [Gemmata algarum]MDY3552489.1 hypothetical protein [Gemmata algarum]